MKSQGHKASQALKGPREADEKKPRVTSLRLDLGPTLRGLLRVFMAASAATHGEHWSSIRSYVRKCSEQVWASGHLKWRFLSCCGREVGGRETGFNHVAYVRLWPLASSILFRCDFNHEVTLDPQKDRVPDAVKPISSETFGRSMVNLARRCSRLDQSISCYPSQALTMLLNPTPRRNQVTGPLMASSQAWKMCASFEPL